MQIDSLPTEIDALERRIVQLEIERQALLKETDAHSVERRKQIEAELAKLLTRMAGLDRAFFCNSGTEAWEGALKLARAYAHEHSHNGHKAKWRMLALENSFHGRTFGSLATTYQKKYRAPFAPLLPGVNFVAFNDLDDLFNTFFA